MTPFLIVLANWAIKLFMSWLAYLLAIWLQVPEWAMIAMIAIATTSGIKAEGYFSNGMKWDIK